LKRTGPLSWLLDHICVAAHMFWADLFTVASYWRKPPLPRRQRTTSGWRADLPPGHPDYWCCLPAAQDKEWADIREHLGNFPAVPQPRRPTP
jgi:hypothetical protein